jgi:hypothetical protein
LSQKVGKGEHELRTSSEAHRARCGTPAGLPDPEAILLLVNAAVGAGLGTLGAVLRRRAPQAG